MYVKVYVHAYVLCIFTFVYMCILQDIHLLMYVDNIYYAMQYDYQLIIILQMCN